MPRTECRAGDYFLPNGQAGKGTYHGPVIYPNSQITPLIDPPEYFKELGAVLERLGNSPFREENEQEYIYIAGLVINWVYPGDPLLVPTSHGPRPLIELVIEKAKAGVDVRVLAWMAWSLAKARRLDARPESVDSVRTLRELRQVDELHHKCCLNILSHPAGGAHSKLVLAGGPDWAVAYTGGTDLSPDRWRTDWLDVQAKVEGPAIQGLYDFFHDNWNQNLVAAGQADGVGPKYISSKTHWLRASRPVTFNMSDGRIEAVLPGTPSVKSRDFSQLEAGDHAAQTLLTVPQFNFAASPFLPVVRVAPLSFAPGGVFEAAQGLERAISQARHYIYAEDQYFWCDEVFVWIGQALRQNPDLKVILATGTSEQLGSRLLDYRSLALLDGLLPGLSEAEESRVILVQRGEMVHSKTMLIDDCWAVIGSTNLACRSLYTDLEHSIAFSGPDDQVVRDYRIRLWARRLGLPAEAAGSLKELERALNVWNPAWGKPWNGPPIHLPFERQPLRPAERPSIDRIWREMVDDPDSRRPWYFPLRRNYASFVPNFASSRRIYRRM